VAILGLVWLLSGRSREEVYQEHVPTGEPPIVIVTVIDPKSYSASYLRSVQENRRQYAEKHGYETFIVEAQDYDTKGYQQSWAKVMAMRHALTKYPNANYIWHLDQDAFIMEPSRTVEEVVADPRVLESLMIRDHSVVPPDSIIKTFQHLKGQEAAMIISQDNDGLVADSVLLKTGDWAQFLTETWMDPLYMSYNFQKAERHALEHIVQWHPTVLSKLALVPQRTMASYAHTNLGEGYREGDFVVMLKECTVTGESSCEKESQWYWQRFRELIVQM